MYNIALVSGGQHSVSVTHIFILFEILFPDRLLQNTVYSFPCSTVGSCWLSTLHIVPCVC